MSIGTRRIFKHASAALVVASMLSACQSMEDGKFAEHWGVGQPVPEESVHENSIF